MTQTEAIRIGRLLALLSPDNNMDSVVQCYVRHLHTAVYRKVGRLSIYVSCCDDALISVCRVEVCLCI